jgi:hypothetical protein
MRGSKRAGARGLGRLTAAALGASLALAAPAGATHFRYGHVTWVPRTDVNPRAIDFKVQDVWRRTTFSTANGRCRNPATLASTACTGAGGFAGVGDLVWESLGGTRLDPGDGTGLIGGPGSLGGALLFLVTAVDVTNNWAFGLGVDPANVAALDTAITHVYPADGTFTAKIEDCCRISPCEAPTAHMNNPDDDYRVATTVNVGGGDNSSPASALPPIILCPLNGTCQFTIPASDNELDPLMFRMSTPLEAGFTSQPGPPQCPNAASIDAMSGVYTWNTVGCRTAASPLPQPPAGGCNQPSYNTCYSTQVTIEEDVSGGSDAALDFLICLVACPPSNTPPVFGGPTPACGSTVSANPGTPVAFTVEASDGNSVDAVTLNVAGLPGGAAMVPALPASANPVSSSFSWTPGVGDLGQHVMTFTATDPCGAQTLCSITVDVSQEDCTDGGDNDGDGLADCADPDCADTECDDGLFCTVNDICQSGQCSGSPRSCDDGEVCTADTCNETTNACVNNPTPLNGTACDTDGDLCTVDHCSAGSCVNVSVVSCQAAEPPCEGGATCNPATGACVAQPDAPSGTACNADGNLCTVDTCNGSGSCVQTGTVSCQAAEPPCEGGATCSPATGACVAQPDAPSGTACNADGNLCTIDTCNGSGSCVQTGTVSCPAAEPPCEGGATCSPATGACVAQPDAPSNTSCEADGNRCTVDVCNGSGSCLQVTTVACQVAEPPCEGGATCNPATGACVAQPDAPSGTACDADGSLCTIDACDGLGGCGQSGTVSCPATVPPCEGGATCNPATGACVAQPDAPSGTACDADGSLCTTEACNGSGTCVQTGTVSCPAAIPPCEGGATCNPATGVCVAQPDAPSGTACNADGNLCTTDACNGSGSCVQTGTVGCQPPTPPCEGGTACNPATGTCVAQPDAPSGTACDTDGNLCTIDMCNGTGACTQTGTVSCPAGPDCQGGELCNPASGACEPQPPSAAGTPCDTDASQCTQEECNGSGGCVPVGTVACAPPQPPCEGGEACVPSSGQCEPRPDPPIGTPCDTDGDPGTEEQCDGKGECSDNPPLDLCENLLGNFKGYSLGLRQGFVPVDVALVDQFETKDTTVIRAKYLANPAGIDGSGIVDPTAHLMCYKIKDVTGQTPFVRTDLRLETQFGTHLVTTHRTEALCVPATKDRVPLASTFDRFKCYTLRKQKRAPRFVKREITVDEQFETKLMRTFKPHMICNPVSMGGEEIQNPVCHLTCYKVRDVFGQSPFLQRTAVVEDEFGARNVGTNTATLETCRKAAVVCVPSLKFHD